MNLTNILIICLIAQSTVGGAAYAQDGVIQGGVTDNSMGTGMAVPMVAPVLSPEGGAQGGSAGQSHFHEHANQHEFNLDAARNAPPVLSGQASQSGSPALTQEDPDSGDQQLAIDWDTWRNRFVFQVQDNLQAEMNNSNPSPNSLVWNPQTQQMVQPQLPLGTMCWFYCQITPDRRIINLRLVHPSGYPSYDQEVLQAVAALNGSAILAYPPRSKRRIVTQIAGIKTATTTSHKYINFGDVEHRAISH